MTLSRRMIGAAGVSLFCLLVADAALSETLQFSFDGRQWREDFRGCDRDQILTKYVLPGETVGAWTEIVTTEVFSGLQSNATAEEFAAVSKKNLDDLCPDIRFKYHKKSSQDVIYEWMTSGCPGQSGQHEIARIMTSKEALYSIHYTTKIVPMPDDDHQKWISILANATIS